MRFCVELKFSINKIKDKSPYGSPSTPDRLSHESTIFFLIKNFNQLTPQIEGLKTEEQWYQI
jgi:hypothetical protein